MIYMKGHDLFQARREPMPLSPRPLGRGIGAGGGLNPHLRLASTSYTLYIVYKIFDLKRGRCDDSAVWGRSRFPPPDHSSGAVFRVPESVPNSGRPATEAEMAHKLFIGG